MEEQQTSDTSVSPSQPSIPNLPGVTTILSEAWLLYKRRWKTLLGVMVIPTLIWFLIGFLGNESFFSISFGLGLVVLFLLVALVSTAWSQTALVYAIKDSEEGIGVVEAYRRGWHKILSCSWIIILQLFIVMGGILLLVVPGIVFIIWFNFSVFILVAEDLGGLNALLKSREYVRGKLTKISGYLMFIGFLYVVISLPFSMIPDRFVAGGEIGSLMPSMLLGPLTTSYLFLVYKNLKSVKGEFVFSPTRGQKAKLIIVAVLGLIISTLFVFILITLLVAQGLGTFLMFDDSFQNSQPGPSV